MAESNPSQSTESNFTNHLFREIYKNAYLSKVTGNPSEKSVANQTVFWTTPKPERFWFVFCIHDDTEAYLEAYSDKKNSLMHRPQWSTYLNNTLHVSSTICSEYKEYEFVITVNNGVVRLLAPTRDAMTDWVDTLRTKLTEMKILTPCKNMYTPLPVQQPKTPPLLSTRDPTSPLPPPPPNHPIIPLGTELPSSSTRTTPIINNCDNNHEPSITSNTNSSNEAEPYITVIQVTSSSSNEVPAESSRQVFTFDNIPEPSVSSLTEESEDDFESCLECDTSCSHYDCVFVPDIVGSMESTSNGSTAAINHLTREMTQLTLREQQALRLQKEIKHPTGVRIQLSRKDCNNAIALVDVFGGVWVAGWKQKDNPMLYNLLHIGDQIISIDNVNAQNAADVHKHLKRAAATSRSVTVIVKRVPFGKIFVIQREVEGQPLGIVQDQNTAVIKQVLANSLAARHGLSQRATTCDQLSFTNWVLTEINGRPLNLFYKNTEIKDRLNAIGREISILVQPLDLIKQIKKQFKSIRNYKDYIVQ